MRKRTKRRIFLLTTIFTGLLAIGIYTEIKTRQANAVIYAEPTMALYPREAYYPHYETLHLTAGKGYEFKNPNSKKLLITLDSGPSWEAQVGKEGKRLSYLRLIDWLLPFYTYYDYTIFVPEIFDWEEDEYLYYWNTTTERERNTFGNVQACFEEVINEYISKNNYDTIVIAGVSAGAIHLPMVYPKLDSSKISSLISISYGALPVYESYSIMYSKYQAGEKPFEVQEYWVNLAGIRLKTLLNYYNEDPRRDTINRIGFLHQVTFKYLNSILDQRPFEYYEGINIPVLFIHGERDRSFPVESTKYVEANLPGKPFDFIYYPEMGHGPDTREELYEMREDIKDWLTRKGLL